MTQRRDPESGSIKVKNGNAARMLVAALLGAVVVMMVNQFVPMITGRATNATNIAALERHMNERFDAIEKDIGEVKEQIDRTMAVHKEATAHDGALQILIQHGEKLTDHERRLRTLEKQP